MSTEQPLRLLTIFLTLSAAPCASAEPGVPTSLAVDLDADGKPEKVCWELFSRGENDEEFYQLRVLGPEGELVWEGPRVADPENPLVLGNGGFDFGFPEIAADIDGDGAVELVVHLPQSDVSPSYFSVLRWKGDRFVHARSGSLLHTAKLKAGEFPWSQGEEWEGDWISTFKRANPDGSLVVDVFEYIGAKSPRQGEAVVVPTPQGFRVKEWTAPLKVLGDMPAPEPSGPPVPAGRVSYRARLGAGDHFNSSGDLLEKVGDILRQDRANYHRGRGDRDDDPDPLFGSARGRDGIDQRKIIPVGVSAAALTEAITKHTPLVEVEVTAEALEVKLVE